MFALKICTRFVLSDQNSLLMGLRILSVSIGTVAVIFDNLLLLLFYVQSHFDKMPLSLRKNRSCDHIFVIGGKKQNQTQNKAQKKI